MDDTPQADRPVKVDSDQIKILIENKQRYTMREIADILKISKSIKLQVKMKNVSFILWIKLCELFCHPKDVTQEREPCLGNAENPPGSTAVVRFETGVVTNFKQ